MANKSAIFVSRAASAAVLAMLAVTFYGVIAL